MHLLSEDFFFPAMPLTCDKLYGAVVIGTEAWGATETTEVPRNRPPLGDVLATL